MKILKLLKIKLISNGAESQLLLYILQKHIIAISKYSQEGKHLRLCMP